MVLQKNLPFLWEADRIHMKISDAMHVALDSSWHCRDARAGFTRMYYVIGGEGELCFADGRIPLLPGNIYILPAFLPFGYSCGTYLEKFFCHVNLYGYDGKDMLESVGRCVVLPERNEEISGVLSLFEKGDKLSAVLFRQALMKTLCEALRVSNISLGQTRIYSPVVTDAISYISSHLHAGLTASAVAAALHVSESKLQKAFRTEMAQSAGRYITGRVLAEAEERLRCRGESIQQISDALGFCDRFYFSRLFSARYGAPPAAYRKKVLPPQMKNT